MIFTLTDRHYNVLDAYETDDYLIGQYIGSILETLEINVLVKSLNAEHWVEGNYIMCQDKMGKKRWFTIYDCDDSHGGDVKSLFCYSGTIDIVAEDAAPISAPDPKPFKWYFDQIFYDTGIVLGVNEISDLTRKLEFTSENASNAEMLQYVLNGFDNAEASLDVEFDGATPTKLVLNVYKRIGNEEPQTVLSDEDDSLTSLDRKGSISDLATCINPTGAEDENGNPITLLGKYYEERDEQGNILYYSPVDSPRVFSVVARRDFYVQLPGKANGEFDGYINRRYTSQATTQDALWQESLAQLKKIDHVAVTYEANGYIDCSIGDNVQIVSHEMKPPVMIAARTIEYKFNDDDPSRNVYKFGNYVELTSNLDELSKIIAEVKKQVEPQVIEAERNAKVYAETISAEKAAQAEENAKGYTDTVKVQVVEHANTVANQAENNAKEHADTVAGEAESNAKAYALSEADKARIAAIQAAATDAQTKVNAAKTALEASIAEKADAEWVNGQLVLKENAITKSNTAPSNPTTGQLWLDTSTTPNVLKRWTGSAWVKATPTSAGEVGAYTKTEVDNALNSKVSVTQYNTDMNGVVTRLNSAESSITQNENEIATKVSNTTYQQDKTTINNNISQLQTKMSNAETSISQLSSQIALKANATDVYTKSQVDGQFSTVNQQISQLDAELTVQAGQIASKVSKTDLQSLKNGILKVRYVRDWAKGNSVNSRNHWVEVKVMSGTTNRASGKTPTSNYSLTYGNRVTDGDTNSSNYAEGALGAVSQYVQIDLGAVYEDIDYIQVWHYYNDGRTYNGTKVEVSADGTNWITVFDSAVSGTYKETADGLIVPINNSVLNSFNKRVSSAETSITQLSNQIQLKANQSTVDTLANRISSAESTLTIHTNQIASKVSQTTFESALSGKENTVYKQNTAPAHANGRFWLDTSKTPNVLYRSNGSAWIKVTPTLAGEVGAFSQADGNTLAGRLSTAESTITQQADLISQKVSKTDYNGNTIASLINQTATTIKIQASKINLVGAVTVLSDITGNLGDITAGNISGVNITGVTITGSTIISDGVWQTIQSRVQLGNGVITVGDSSANNTVSPVGFIVEQDGGRLHHEFGADGILFYGSAADVAKAGIYVQYESYGNGISMVLEAENYTAVTSKFWVRNNEARFQSTENFIDPEPNVKKAIKVSGGIATDVLYANARSVNKDAIRTSGKIYVGGEGIEVVWPGGTPYIDFTRVSGADYNARIIIQSDSSLAFMFDNNSTIRHRFYANGTKSGGSIEIDSKNLGMSPIDSPQVLLETIEFDVPLTADGTKVLLDSRFAKAVNYRFAVFPNNGRVIEKGPDYFIIAGDGLADIRIVGERVGYAGVYFDDMTMEGVT